LNSLTIFCIYSFSSKPGIATFISIIEAQFTICFLAISIAASIFQASINCLNIFEPEALHLSQISKTSHFLNSTLSNNEVTKLLLLFRGLNLSVNKLLVILLQVCFFNSKICSGVVPQHPPKIHTFLKSKNHACFSQNLSLFIG
jgi:hypothetical protein